MGRGGSSEGVVLGTFQDERELVWLESEEGGGRQSNFGFCYICALSPWRVLQGMTKQVYTLKGSLWPEVIVIYRLMVVEGMRIGCI